MVHTLPWVYSAFTPERGTGLTFISHSTDRATVRTIEIAAPRRLGHPKVSDKDLLDFDSNLQTWNEYRIRIPSPHPNIFSGTRSSVMEYGAAYLRPQSNSDDDAVSMLSEHRASQYQPYRLEHRRQSSSLSNSPATLGVSPVALSQSLPPMPGSDAPYSPLRPSVFGSRAVLNEPFTEPTAWEQSTQFRSNRPESPKPEVQPTVTALSQSGPPRSNRRYFRHPRHIPEPWRTGFWVRFPWRGFAALFTILLCLLPSRAIDANADRFQ